MRTTLTARFAEHLAAGAPSGAGAAAFAAALRADGYQEGELLERAGWHTGDVGGQGVHQRVFVGRHAPADAAIGDHWLDTVEVMPMLRIELPAQGTARPATPGWIAVRPVARWQFRGFAAAAPLVDRAVQVTPETVPMDPARLAGGDDTAPITSITFGEATLYAWYFGKSIAGTHAWSGAAGALGDAVARLWTDGLYELGGYGFQEDERLRFGAATWRLDPDDDPGDDAAIVVDEMFVAADTGFRTAGDGSLVIEPTANLPTFEPIALARGFAR